MWWIQPLVLIEVQWYVRNVAALCSTQINCNDTFVICVKPHIKVIQVGLIGYRYLYDTDKVNDDKRFRILFTYNLDCLHLDVALIFNRVHLLSLIVILLVSVLCSAIHLGVAGTIVVTAFSCHWGL